MAASNILMRVGKTYVDRIQKRTLLKYFGRELVLLHPLCSSHTQGVHDCRAERANLGCAKTPVQLKKHLTLFQRWKPQSGESTWDQRTCKTCRTVVLQSENLY